LICKVFAGALAARTRDGGGHCAIAARHRKGGKKHAVVSALVSVMGGLL
jgi:predicted phage gp36 major capsid-like protein